jgi:hypothetical protein
MRLWRFWWPGTVFAVSEHGIYPQIMQEEGQKNSVCHLWVDGNTFYGLPICIVLGNACGRGVDIASIFILKNPDTLRPHFYGCLTIRYTTIPYQKSAQPPRFPRKVILVMLPAQHTSLSSSVSFVLLFVFNFVCRTRATGGGESHLLGIFVACQLAWDQSDISTLDYF